MVQKTGERVSLCDSLIGIECGRQAERSDGASLGGFEFEFGCIGIGCWDGSDSVSEMEDVSARVEGFKEASAHRANCWEWKTWERRADTEARSVISCALIAHFKLEMGMPGRILCRAQK